MKQHEEHKSLEERQKELLERIAKRIHDEPEADKPKAPTAWHHRPGEGDDQS
jgi:F0F1-type ATP synthase assembly protein I